MSTVLTSRKTRHTWEMWHFQFRQTQAPERTVGKNLTVVPHFRPGQFRPNISGRPIQARPVSGPPIPFQACSISGLCHFRPDDFGPAQFRPIPFQAKCPIRSFLIPPKLERYQTKREFILKWKITVLECTLLFPRSYFQRFTFNTCSCMLLKASA